MISKSEGRRRRHFVFSLSCDSTDYLTRFLPFSWPSNRSDTEASSRSTMAPSAYTMDNPVFRHFLFYAVASLLKMMAMSFFTGRQRFLKIVSRESVTRERESIYRISVQGLCESRGYPIDPSTICSTDHIGSRC